VTDETDIGVYLGLDVGKGEHHAAAVNRVGKKVFDKPLPNSEPKLRELFDKLRTKHGTVLLVVDQPASIGALPLAVARDAGCQVAYLPGLTMRRIADLYPGEAKTDARDAFVIADAARAMPHTLRAVDPDDEAVAGFFDCGTDYADAMSPSGWTRLAEAHGVRRRLAIVGGHVIRRPFLILALACLSFLITRFGKDLPVLYGMAPLGAFLILGSMGRYRPVSPAVDSAEEPLPPDDKAN
jgi:hypothetical protein